jgi:hypothetical protein
MKVMFITGSAWMRDENWNLKPFIRDPYFTRTFTMFGDRLIYPEIYWYEGDYIFPYLERIIEKEKIDLIISYSAGGHPGFHLCNKYKIRGIHFNPAIASTSEAPTLQILPEEYKNIPFFPEQVIILGENDKRPEGVDAHLVLKYLEGIGFDEKSEILIVPQLGHGVPIPIFKMIFEHYRGIWWGN